MTQDDMKRLLNTTAGAPGAKERSNLGMLCSSVSGLESLVVVRDTIDMALGSNTHLRAALQGWGFAPEGTLAPAERCRLYAALWNSMTGGVWAINVVHIDRRFRELLTMYMGRIHRAAAMTVFDGETESFGEAATEVIRRLEDRDSEVFTCRGLAQAQAAGHKDEVARLSSFCLPFPAFADALESVVQYADKHTTRSPGSLLLWRLYCVVRVCEGFPTGAPHSVSATSGFGLVSSSAAAALAGSDDRSAFVSSRPALCSEERYLVELGPKSSEAGGGDVRHVDFGSCPSAEARRFGEQISSTHLSFSDDEEIAALIRQPGAIAALNGCRGPSWTDLRWSSRTSRPVPVNIANGASMTVCRRAWWSAGTSRILDLFVDEEDAARLAGMTAAYSDVVREVACHSMPTAVDGTSAEAQELAVAVCLLDGEGGPLSMAALRRAAAAEERAGASSARASRRDRPAPRSGHAVAVVAGRVQPRLLTWFDRFLARVGLDASGEAAVSRWLVTVLSDERWDSAAGKGAKGLGASKDLVEQIQHESHFALCEPADGVVRTAPGHDEPWGSEQCVASRSVVEVGGPPLLTHLLAMWYRVNLEVASAATALDAAKRRVPEGTARLHEEAGETSAVARRFQLAFPPLASSGGAAAAADDEDDVHTLHEGDVGAALEAAATSGSAAAAALPRGAASTASWASLPLERLCVVTEGTPDPSRSPAVDYRSAGLSWTRATEVAWRAMRDDVLYAAYSACFPPPLPARLGTRPTHNDIAASYGQHVEPGPGGAEGGKDVAYVTTWDGLGMPMRASAHVTEPARFTPAAERGAASEAPWDGDDPFDEAALWRACKPMREGGEVPTNQATPTELIEASRTRRRGRVTVMRWLVHVSDEATNVRVCGFQAREEGLLAPYDPSEPGASDDWAAAVAVGVWAQVRKAAQLRADLSAPGANLSGLLHADVPQTGFVADVLAAASLPDTRDDWLRTPPSLVRAWALSLIGRLEDGTPDPRFAVGVDTLLALAIWRDVERIVPSNAGALADLEPLAPAEAAAGRGLPTPAALLGGAVPSDLAWLTPARVLALLVALAQSSSPRVRRWAATAKRVLADVRFANEPRKARLTGLEPRHAAVIQDQSAVWLSLFRHRDTLAPMRLSVAEWAELPAAGVDTIPGAEVDPFEGSAGMFGRCLRLAGWSSINLLEQLRHARTDEA